MKLLKHPVRSIREPFGIAGVIVACVALVAALGGGAYAASGGLTGKQKKEVEKIAKKYAGQPGATGAAGSAGPTGPAGAKGDTGAKGETGSAGSNGSPGGPGANGKSVVATQIGPGEATCHKNGGAVYEVEDSGEPTEICNGSEGSPWALKGLPKGATETGVWTFNASEASASGGRVFVPISFSVPLSQKITGEANIHYVEAAGDATCQGKLTEPKAPEGMICIYVNEVVGANFASERELNGEGNNVVDVVGGYIVFNGVENEAYGRGSFAVTGK